MKHESLNIGTIKVNVTSLFIFDEHRKLNSYEYYF